MKSGCQKGSSDWNLCSGRYQYGYVGSGQLEGLDTAEGRNETNGPVERGRDKQQRVTGEQESRRPRRGDDEDRAS